MNVYKENEDKHISFLDSCQKKVMIDITSIYVIL